jgi:hypothetical protein
MSSAFIRESDYQPLSEVAPNLSSLLLYLRRENGGAVVSGVRSYKSEKYNREVHEMSDGLTYALNNDDKWTVLLDL